MPRNFAILLIFFLAPSAALAQSFSCRSGRPACLDYGDQVVDQSAVCLKRNACDYKGFACKSDLDEAASEYSLLADKYNDLLRKHKLLLEAAQELEDKNRQLVNDYNELLEKYRMLAMQHNNAIEDRRKTTSEQYNIPPTTKLHASPKKP